MNSRTRGLYRFCRHRTVGAGSAVLIFSVLTLLIGLACHKASPPAVQTATPKEVIDLLSLSFSLDGVPQPDSAGILVERALAALDRCSTATVSDSVLIHYLLSWHYLYALDSIKAGHYSSVALDIMQRDPNTADSIRREMGAIQSAYLDAADLWDTTAIPTGRDTLSKRLHLSKIRTVTAQRLWVLAEQALGRGDIDAALSLESRLLGMVDSLSEEEDWLFMDALRDFGRVHWDRGEYAKAEALLIRCHQMTEKSYGSDDERSANSLSALSMLYLHMGQQYKGIEMAKRAITILESLPDANRRSLSYAYHSLGAVYVQFDQYARAEECFRKEAALDSVFLASGTTELWLPLTSLGDIKRMERKFDEAESFYAQALELASRRSGDHSAEANRVQWSLGLFYLATGQSERAETTFLRVSKDLKRSGTLTHARLIQLETHLALAAAMQGRHTEAIARIRDAEGTLRAQTFPSFYSMRPVLRAGAEIFRAAHKYDSSFAYFSELLTINRDFMERSFPFLTESQRLQWISADPPILSGLLSLAVQTGEPRYLDAAFQMTINGKGKAIDAALAERQIALCTETRQAEPILEEYLRVSGELANLTYLQMTQESPNVQNRKLIALREKRDSLELSLSMVCLKSGETLTQRQISSAEAVAELGSNDVLWTIVRYCPTDSIAVLINQSCTCGDHYAVFICDASGIRGLYDAGPVSVIDSLVLALRSAIKSAPEYVHSSRGPIHEAEIRNLADQITKRLPPLPARDSSSPGRLYVSPDGLLGLLPFELLTVDSSHYLIDSYRIGYLSSFRDVTGDSSTVFSSRQAVVLASPAYESPGDPDHVPVVPADAGYGRQDVREVLADCFGSGFVPLPQTRKEAGAVAALLSENRVLTSVRTGQQASESYVRSFIDSPGILHFATHGFFCDQVVSSQLSVVHSPMLRTGLALAGANRTLRGAAQSPMDDGILTAYEVSAMDLSSTDLVVLSACETGAGDVTRSEGVMGLTRAFRQAGAKSVVMNLWNTSDRVASETMTEFYRLWTGGKSRADALRGALLSAKERARLRYGHTHPYFWCGFVLMGNTK